MNNQIVIPVVGPAVEPVIEPAAVAPPNAEEQDHSAVYNDGVEAEDVKVETKEIGEPAAKADEGISSEKAVEKTEETAEEAEKRTKQEKIDHAFKKKQFELKEAQEEAVILKREKAEIQARLDKQAVPVRPIIPDIPDTYDPKYEQKMAERDNSIKAQQSFDQKAKTREEVAQHNQQVMVQNRQEEIKQNQAKFEDKIKELGLNREEFSKAEKYVLSFAAPVNMATIEHIQKHKNGPLLVQYLAQDHEALERVSKMHPMEAAEYIATEITPKAVGLKPKTPAAPQPVKTLDSKGATKPENPAIKGAVFE